MSDTGTVQTLEKSTRWYNTLLVGRDVAYRRNLLVQLATQVAPRPVYHISADTLHPRTLQDPREGTMRPSLIVAILERVCELVGATVPDYRTPALAYLELIEIISDHLDEYQNRWSERPIITIDQLDPVTAHALFCRMRDEMWAIPTAWIMSGESEHVQRYLAPPPDFWTQVVNLDTGRAGPSFLSESAAS